MTEDSQTGLDAGSPAARAKKKAPAAPKAPVPAKKKNRDPEKVLEACLAPFKVSERPEVVVFVDDPDARKVAVGWMTFRVGFEIPAEKLPLERDDEGKGIATPDLWQWVWKGVPNIRWKGFVEKLADHCGVDRAKVKPIFDVLKANRVIYPDNSLNEWASKGIGHEVARRYQGTRRLT